MLFDNSELVSLLGLIFQSHHFINLTVVCNLKHYISSFIFSVEDFILNDDPPSVLCHHENSFKDQYHCHILTRNYKIKK